MCVIARTTNEASLVYVRAFGRVEPLLVAAQRHLCLSQRYALNCAQLFVAGHQEREVLLNGSRKRVDRTGTRPVDSNRFLRGELDGMQLYSGGRARDLARARGRRLNAFAREIVGRCKSPRFVDENADANAQRLGVR